MSAAPQSKKIREKPAKTFLKMLFVESHDLLVACSEDGNICESRSRYTTGAGTRSLPQLSLNTPRFQQLT